VRADLVLAGDGLGAGAVVGLAEQQGPGKQETAGQPGGLLFLLGVARDEGLARELLDFPDVVVEQDVSELVANVAVGASVFAEGVEDGDGPAVGKVEGRCGERPGLDLLELLEAGAG
jgi:hypothetical protein